MKLLLAILAALTTRCAQSGSNPAARDWSPVANQINCAALNTLPNGTSFDLTTPDGIVYQILNSQVTEVSVPILVDGTLTWDSCAIVINHGTFVSATWN